MSEQTTQPKNSKPLTARPAVNSGGPSLAGNFPNNRQDESARFTEQVFSVDEATFRSSMPRVTHWSIAWSDLMMTMFILFLSLFVYQAAHEEFLVSDEVEVIGGETAEALETGNNGEPVFPFVPIEAGAPLMTSGTVKKVEPLRLKDIDIDTSFFAESTSGGMDRIISSLEKPAPRQAPEIPAARGEPLATANLDASAAPGPPVPPDRGEERVDTIFSLDEHLLATLDLDEFASVTLVPDTTVRIILTGDLLFDTGKAELTRSSLASLRKIAAVIKNTPYMINIVGHTDNIPMHSARFETNWELSVARASRVARFLIEDMGMSPNQFVVSGYGPFRPIKPNTTAVNRAANRRVEIIISKRLPAPVAATPENIK